MCTRPDINRLRPGPMLQSWTKHFWGVFLSIWMTKLLRAQIRDRSPKLIRWQQKNADFIFSIGKYHIHVHTIINIIRKFRSGHKFLLVLTVSTFVPWHCPTGHLWWLWALTFPDIAPMDIFDDCEHLRSLTLPQWTSLMTVSTYVPWHCPIGHLWWLWALTFPDIVPMDIFDDCEHLSSLTLSQWTSLMTVST